jgi:two-component system, chemotaxis family, chemotaxis protein CheY
MTDAKQPIYLVHNDSDVLLSLYDVLSAAGFQVGASSNAFDALAYIARSRPRAVLCRCEMPEMMADEFIVRTKRVSPETRLLMCSPSADARLYERLRALGAIDLVREPMSPSAALHAISRAFGLGVPYDDSNASAIVDLSGKGQISR